MFSLLRELPELRFRFAHVRNAIHSTNLKQQDSKSGKNSSQHSITNSRTSSGSVSLTLGLCWGFIMGNGHIPTDPIPSKENRAWEPPWEDGHLPNQVLHPGTWPCCPDPVIDCSLLQPLKFCRDLGVIRSSSYLPTSSNQIYGLCHFSRSDGSESWGTTSTVLQAVSHIHSASLDFRARQPVSADCCWRAEWQTGSKMVWVAYLSQRPREQMVGFSQGPLGTAFHLAKAPQGLCYLCKAERTPIPTTWTKQYQRERAKKVTVRGVSKWSPEPDFWQM